MKILPILLAGGIITAAALAPLAQKADPTADLAQQFVDCSDRLGPAACGHFLDQWDERPNAHREIVERFARDKAFALHLIAFGDAQITTGSIKR